MFENMHFERPGTLAGRAAAAWRSGVARLADAVLPPLCLSCRSSIDGHGGLCASCWSRVDFIGPPLCDRLGLPLPYSAGEPMVSAAALANPPVFDRARAAASYGTVVRQLVHDLKFRDRHEGRALLVRWMAHAGRELLEGADVLVPVPLARLRLWSRRFNQSALLADGLSRLSGVAADPFALRRTRRTVPQVGLTVDQRRRNVAGAFEVPRTRDATIAGRHVVLVDDVMTTGATADACARTLKGAGAVHVDVLVLARVVDPVVPSL